MKVVKKFQQGGEMGGQPAPEQMPAGQGAAPAPEQEQGGSPEEQVMTIAQDIIQQMGPEMAAMLAQVIMEMLQGGGQPQQQPTFQRKGGILTRKN